MNENIITILIILYISKCCSKNCQLMKKYNKKTKKSYWKSQHRQETRVYDTERFFLYNPYRENV